jgi:uncharacterized protein YjdB
MSPLDRTFARAARLVLLFLSALLVVATSACGRTVTEDFASPGTTSGAGGGATTSSVGPDGGQGGNGQGGHGQGGHALGGSGQGGDAGLPDGGAKLLSIGVTPPLATAVVGTKAVLVATAVYSDGTSTDVTAQAAWTSSAPSIATVAAGVVAALAPGSATITAAFQGLTATASITVPNASIASIAVTPLAATTGVGGTVAFTAVATLSDQSHQDVTASATWTSSSAAVASVGPDGQAQGLSAGATTIRATVGAVFGEAKLTVSSATLVSIAVTPTDPSVGVGVSIPFTATGTYSDASIADVTATATWTSSDGSVVGVAAGGKATTLAVGVSVVTAAVGNVSGSSTVTVKSATLTSIAIAPAATTLGVGGTAPLEATGTYSDASTADLTGSVAWSSGAPGVASVSNAQGSQGVVTALAAGSATITAALGNVSGTATVQVSAAPLVSIAIAPPNGSAPKGTTLAFTATATYADKTTADVTTSVTWSTDDAGVATISNAGGTNGVATAVSAGTTGVHAALSGVTGSATLTVTSATLASIAVTPANPSLSIGLKQPMKATGTYSDASTVDLTASAVWTTADVNVATVSNASGAQGLLAAVGAGTTTVTATFGGISGATTVTVAKPTLVQVVVSPIAPSVPIGQHPHFTAMAIYSNNASQNVTGQAQWSSSSPAVAAFNGQPGVATALAAGTTTITATFQGKSGTTPLTVTSAVPVSISVTPIDPTLAAGSSQNFTAMAIFSDNSSQNVTAQATWTSSNANVLGVGDQGPQKGRAKALSAGSAVVTASWQGLSGTSTVTVSSAVLVAISVSPATVTVPTGTYQTFTAQAIYSDNTSKAATGQATWTSSNPSIAGVSDQGATKGLAKSVAPGTATIQAAWGGLTGQATMIVSGAKVVSIELSPASPTVALGVPQKFFATAIMSDNTSQDVTPQATWTSSDPSIAAVSDALGSKGLTQTLAAGQATISATWNGVTGSTGITVSAAKLVTIQVTPFSPTLPVGFKTSFQATGVYSDNTTQDLTLLATWTSSAPATASVSDANVTKGQVTPLAAGAATINASYLGVTGTDAVTVSSATLVSIAITPANASVAVGAELALAATGTFTDQSTMDVTDYVTWLSSTPAIVSISNAKGSQGVAKGLSKGSVTVSAVRGGVTGTTSLTVP